MCCLWRPPGWRHMVLFLVRPLSLWPVLGAGVGRRARRMRDGWCTCRRRPAPSSRRRPIWMRRRFADSWLPGMPPRSASPLRRRSSIRRSVSSSTTPTTGLRSPLARLGPRVLATRVHSRCGDPWSPRFVVWCGPSRRARYPPVVPRKTVHDPHWEPYSALVKLYVTPSQRHDLDQLVTELRVSRSLLVRLAIEAGLPDVVADLRRRRRAALRPGGRTRGRRSAAASVRRGASGASDVVDAWREPSKSENAELRPGARGPLAGVPTAVAWPRFWCARRVAPRLSRRVATC